MDTLVEFEVHQLGERGRAYLANERLVAGVQSRVSFQIGRGAKTLLTHVAFVWAFSWKLQRDTNVNFCYFFISSL